MVFKEDSDCSPLPNLLLKPYATFTTLVICTGYTGEGKSDAGRLLLIVTRDAEL
jgi:hypothetical protein